MCVAFARRSAAAALGQRSQAAAKGGPLCSVPTSAVHAAGELEEQIVQQHEELRALEGQHKLLHRRMQLLQCSVRVREGQVSACRAVTAILARRQQGQKQTGSLIAAVLASLPLLPVGGPA